MIPVGAMVRCLSLDFVDRKDTPIRTRGVVLSNSRTSGQPYMVRVTSGTVHFFRPHQIEELPICKTEIYKALTEG